jgi:hypothetical protein
MKIIALHRSSLNNSIIGAVVDLNYSELADIVGPTCSREMQYAHTGCTLKIGDQYRHAMQVVGKIAEASKLPEQLRTLSSMLELSHPALANVVEPTVVPETE